MIKRAMDLVGSVAGLLVLSPLLLAIAAAIKLTSSGPVFFRQERVGLLGQKFRIFKFRTMVQDAETRGAKVTAGGDARITPFGRWLRSHKLDELPQLINVVNGQMSLVGPRPEVQEFADLFPGAYETILTVKPGITHKATLVYRDEEKLLATATDPRSFYIDRVMPAKLGIYQDNLHQNLLEELEILARTVLPWKGDPVDPVTFAVVPESPAAEVFMDAPVVSNIPLVEEDLPARIPEPVRPAAVSSAAPVTEKVSAALR